MVKFFKIKKKPYFGVTFSQRGFFLKTSAMYNCRDPPAFKCQRYRVDCSSNQKLFHHYLHARTVQSICSIHQIICKIHLIHKSHKIHKNPMIYRASHIFDYAHPIIIKVTINFPEFVLACKKSANFINSFLR